MNQPLIRQLISLVCATSISAVVLLAAMPTAVSSPTDDGLATTLVNQLNAARQERHLTPVMIDARLTAAAQTKANELMSGGRFDHLMSDGRTPWDFIRAAGYRYELAGENLAMDFTQPADITAAWLDSSAHRSTMLDPNFSDVGIATVSGNFHGHETIIVVELFGRPHPTSPIEQAIFTFVDRLSKNDWQN